MRAFLRRLHSPDVEDLESYRPERPDEFGFLLQIFAGPEDGQGEESFDVVVCTPRWLERKHGRQDVVVGRHHLIVFEYDYDRLVKVIELYCESSEGKSWRDVAQKLSRLGKWEFEDYSEQ
jgi:hypothetical protein